jgi:hypothetical protein
MDGSGTAIGRDLQLRETEMKGRGVFAARPFRKQERILEFRGPLLHLFEVMDFSRCIQAGPEHFFGPSGEPDDYVNHSCDPSCGLRDQPRGRLVLVSLRPIKLGEEITYDYSTSMLAEPWTLTCSCGADACRGIIRAFSELLPELRASYEALGIVPSFIRFGTPAAVKAQEKARRARPHR